MAYKNDETSLSDSAALKILGERLAAMRLDKNLKQDDVAREAGIGLRTLQRLESGASASRLSSLVRVLRVLGIMENLDRIVPTPSISPISLLKQQQQHPKRASRARRTKELNNNWSWDE